MPLDPSIALQTQAPNPANFISGFLDLGQKKLALDKGRATFDSDVAQARAQSSSAQSAAQVSAASVQPAIAQNVATSSTTQSGAAVAAASVAPSIAQNQAVSDQAQTSARLARFKLTGEQAQKSTELASGLVTDPDFVNGNSEAMVDKLNDVQQRMIGFGVDPKTADVTITALKYQATHSPMQVQQSLKNMILGGQSAQGQGGSITPGGPMVNNGQQFGGVNTNPLAAGGVGAAIPGTAGSMQLPPGTPVYDPRTQSPGYLGSQPPQSSFKDPAGALRQIQAMPPGPGRDEALAAAANPQQPRVQSGPALGEAEGVAGTTASNVAHWDGVSKDASAAPTRIGLLQNIKALAPDAVTGDQPAVRKFVSKMAGYFGLKYDEQTATDVMAKEAALLASKGGNTDMARLLNEAATPGGHMTRDAISTTVDQLIGQESLKVAAQKYFAGTPPNSSLYTQKMIAWNRVADPRAFEYATKSPEDRATMRSKMAPADLASLKANIQQLHAMGVSP